MITNTCNRGPMFLVAAATVVTAASAFSSPGGWTARLQHGGWTARPQPAVRLALLGARAQQQPERGSGTEENESRGVDKDSHDTAPHGSAPLSSSCNAARPRPDMQKATRLHSVFHERTDGTVWSSASTGRTHSGGFGGLVRELAGHMSTPVRRSSGARTSAGPRWGEGVETARRGGIATRPVDPLDPFTQELAGRLVWLLKALLGVLYDSRPDFARFYVLETVARVPYFAYISVLHLYESIGRHNRAAWMKVHFAEADNELHHLLIMEALGGDAEWADRWFAQHSALAYYWACVVLYLWHPRAAYHVMSLIEQHAYATYDEYIACNADWLKTQPAPAIAKEYYESPDLYLFDSIHTTTNAARRPRIQSLLDTFVNIRDDEQQHAATMKSLVDHGRLSPPPEAEQAQRRPMGSRLVQ